MLVAIMAGRSSIADDLVFPCSTWDENEKVWLHGRGSVVLVVVSKALLKV